MKLTPELITRARTALVRAEIDLYASQRALRTHGHQKITWLLLAHDALRVKRLRHIITGNQNHCGELL